MKNDSETKQPAHGARVSDAVRAAVNVHGELHLDAVRTEVLINWLIRSEAHEERNAQIFEELQSLLQGILGFGPPAPRPTGGDHD